MQGEVVVALVEDVLAKHGHLVGIVISHAQVAAASGLDLVSTYGIHDDDELGIGGDVALQVDVVVSGFALLGLLRLSGKLAYEGGDGILC